MRKFANESIVSPLCSNKNVVRLYRLSFCPQGRHRRPGEEESDVDIEGFEEEDDGKPKTPAPVRQIDIKM